MDHQKYNWCFLTGKSVGREIRRWKGEDDFCEHKKINLAKYLARLRQGDPYVDKCQLEGRTVIQYREGMRECVPTLDLLRFTEEAASGLHLSLGWIYRSIISLASEKGAGLW